MIRGLWPVSYTPYRVHATLDSEHTESLRRKKIQNLLEIHTEFYERKLQRLKMMKSDECFPLFVNKSGLVVYLW